MKIIVSVLLFITISLVAVSEQKSYKDLLAHWETTKQLSLHRGHCIHETGIDPAILTGLSENIEDSDAIQCFAKCLLKHLELIGEDGSIQNDNLLTMLTFETNDGQPFAKEEVLEECSKIKIEEGCESAFKLAKCIKKQVLKAFT